ncbi:MAG TPA: aromatic acid exporter family protein [Clostridia bacterium]
MDRMKSVLKYVSTHGLGFRTLKTMIAIAVCLMIAYFTDYNDAYYVCSVALLTMQITPKESITLGVQRLLGTILGGVIGTGMLYLSIAINIHTYILTVFSIGLSIFICNLLRLKNASAICALVVMLILIVPLDIQPTYLYPIKRTLETAIGIIIAVAVNYSIKRYPVHTQLEARDIFDKK